MAETLLRVRVTLWGGRTCDVWIQDNDADACDAVTSPDAIDTGEVVQGEAWTVAKQGGA